MKTYRNTEDSIEYKKFPTVFEAKEICEAIMNNRRYMLEKLERNDIYRKLRDANDRDAVAAA